MISLLAGGSLTTAIGYYTPFMFATSLLTPIAVGLLSTLTVSTPTSYILIYQGILGFGAGLGFQGPQFAVQALLAPADIALGIAACQFAQSFGPALVVPAAQTLFTGRLKMDLAAAAPGLNATGLETMGLSDLKDHVSANQLSGTLMGFDGAITQTLFLPLALACLTLAGTVSMEWKSVKQKRS